MIARAISPENSDLIESIRKTIPRPEAIENLYVNAGSGVVMFTWFGRDFVIRSTQEVFERKGQRIFVTAASLLMQMAIKKNVDNRQRLHDVAELLEQAEELINSHWQMDSGMKLLEVIKKNLRGLMRRPNSGDPPSVIAFAKVWMQRKEQSENPG